jgi:hypothetical protein
MPAFELHKRVRNGSAVDSIHYLTGEGSGACRRRLLDSRLVGRPSTQSDATRGVSPPKERQYKEEANPVDAGIPDSERDDTVATLGPRADAISRTGPRAREFLHTHGCDAK